MMWHRMTKFVIVCTLLVTLLAGCGSAQQTTSPPLEDDTGSSEESDSAAETDSQAESSDQQEEDFPRTEPLEERPSHIWWTESGAEPGFAYRSFIQTPLGMAWGPDGQLYISDWTGRHVVRVTPEGEMDDLGLWRTIQPLQEDGPTGVAFDSAGNIYLHNHNRIFRVSTDGEVERVSGIEPVPGFDIQVGGIAISPTDELYYTDMEYGKVYRWNPEGSPVTIAAGVPRAEHMVFGLDGTLYLTRQSEGEVLRVDVETGEVEVFASDVCGFDQCFLAIDLEGDLWVRGIQRLYQFSPEGEEKSFQVDGGTYPGGRIDWGTAGAIAIDDEGGIWVGSYSSSLIYLSPLTPGESDPAFSYRVITHGLDPHDMSIDSSGTLYVANTSAGQLMRIMPDGTVSILHEYGAGNIASVAVDESDAVYLGAGFEIARIESDGINSPYADLTVQRMVFGPDGVLYAVEMREITRPAQIVAITGAGEVEVLAADLDGRSFGTGELHIAPALDEGLYVYSSTTLTLYFLDFEGRWTQIADLSDLQGGIVAMAASPTTGDVYLVPHGQYILYRITPEGEVTRIAAAIPGDPWAMVISQDGSRLYVSESGAINVIAIDDAGS